MHSFFVYEFLKQKILKCKTLKSTLWPEEIQKEGRT